MAKETGIEASENLNKGSKNTQPIEIIEEAPERVSITRVLLMILVPIAIIAASWFAQKLIVKANEKPEPKDRVIKPFAVNGDYAISDDIVLKVKTTGEARPRAESGVAQAEQVLAQEVAEGEIARRDFEELGTGEPTALALRQPQRQRAEAALQAANAELEAANLQLKRTYVNAPFNGRVTNKTSDLGQFVSPGFRLGRIFSTNVFEVRLPLNDPDLAKLKLPIAFVADSLNSAPIAMLRAEVAGEMQIWESRIMRTDSRYDPQTRSLFAIAEIHDPYGRGKSQNGMPLVPGLSVSAEIDGTTLEDVIVLPRAALRLWKKAGFAGNYRCSMLTIR